MRRDELLGSVTIPTISTDSVRDIVSPSFKQGFAGVGLKRDDLGSDVTIKSSFESSQAALVEG